MSNEIILPGKTIGIIGGGQLGRMMALSAKAMGYRVAVMEPTEDSPCGQVADIEIVAPYDDLEAAKKLADVSDVITYEFENVDHNVLTWLEENAYMPQGSELIRITQNRGNEKQAITESGAQVAPYRLIDTKAELEQALTDIGFPSVLKTCRGGYDGKGQVVMRSQDDIEQAIHLLEAGQCILEKWISFQKEISVIVTRSVKGEIQTFPVAENIHIDNILAKTIVPANISQLVEDNAKRAAINIANHLQMVGTLAVEMFVTNDNAIYINELAPRPHNSGHFTMDACETSQFEQHIRAICNWPLGLTTLIKPVVMMNILGEHVEPVLQNIHQFVNCKLHLYGKKEAKLKRKMGHVNILSDDVALIEEKIKLLKIWE